MGNLFKPKTQTVAPPQEAQFMDQIDNINRVTTKRVKQPDGSYAMVTERMPLTPEEQALQDRYKAIETDSLQWIDKLTNNYSRADIPWLDKYLTDYEQTARIGLDKGLEQRTRQEERTLARYGVEDSTSAVQARSIRGADYRGAQEQLTRDMSSIEQQARDSELSKQQGLYSLATGSINANLNRLSSASQLALQSGLSQQQTQQNYFNTVAGVNAQNAANRASASQAGLGNLVGLGSLAAFAAPSLLASPGGLGGLSASLQGFGSAQKLYPVAGIR